MAQKTMIMADAKTELQFEDGTLVKVNGMRPEYMDGYVLIRLVKGLAKELLEARAG